MNYISNFNAYGTLDGLTYGELNPGVMWDPHQLVRFCQSVKAAGYRIVAQVGLAVVLEQVTQ